MDTQAQEVLAELERLALAGLRHETERLEAALRKERKREREEGPKGASLISPVSAVRMSCLDALLLWQRAHDARVQVEEEAAVHASSRAANAEEAST